MRARARALEELGDDPRLAQLFLPVAEALVRTVGVRPGERVLDVATGTGNVALAAARTMDWGTEDLLRLRLSGAFIDVKPQRRSLPWRFPSAPATVDFWRGYSPGTSRRTAALRRTPRTRCSPRSNGRRPRRPVPTARSRWTPYTCSPRRCVPG